MSERFDQESRAAFVSTARQPCRCSGSFMCSPCKSRLDLLEEIREITGRLIALEQCLSDSITMGKHP